ncbi:unnamed protein product [Arabidopsis thaliana]|uniref:Uncharacterized protein n=1 Tax=Arabidopsis thaliana TaxID=3702 RepID=A0A654EF94_ARATH|nr:unnamed protein product [Arabidopsis thaliana]
MFRYFVLNGRGHLSILVSTSISCLCNYLLRTLVQSITHFPLSEKTRSTLFGIVYPHSSRFWCDHGHHLGISVLIPINSSAEFSTKHLPTTLILQIWIQSHRNFIDHLLRDPESICKENHLFQPSSAFGFYAVQAIEFHKPITTSCRVSCAGEFQGFRTFLNVTISNDRDYPLISRRDRGESMFPVSSYSAGKTSDYQLVTVPMPHDDDILVSQLQTQIFKCNKWWHFIVTGRDEIKRKWSNPISLHRGQYQWKE